MTQKEAERKTKYFGAGVSVEVWCVAGEGNRLIRIHRGAVDLRFYGLDELLRELQDLHKRLIAGSDLELWSYRANVCDEPILFLSPEDAIECVAEAHKALKHVQAESVEMGWREVGDIFSAFCQFTGKNGVSGQETAGCVP